MIEELLERPSFSSMESQLSLRHQIQALSRPALLLRLQRLGLPSALAEDRAALVSELLRPDRLRRSVELLRLPVLRDAVKKALDDHGGLLEFRTLGRLGIELGDREAARRELEGSLLGTISRGDAAEIGLRLGPGSLVVFLEFARSWSAGSINVSTPEEPEPLADILADLAALRTYVDHRAVRVTRDGTLYRTTARKVRAEILSPGQRPLEAEPTLDFLLRFLADAELVRPDGAGRLRVLDDWSRFETKTPTERLELLLVYVVNDTREVKGEFHQARLRRTFLTLLKEMEIAGWVDLRTLAILARNRYLLTLDRTVAAERFQKRYKYAPVPPLVGPAGLMSELEHFVVERLGLLGLVDAATDDEGRTAMRLTAIGAEVFGVTVRAQSPARSRSVVLTPDFEIVIFPEASTPAVVHDISAFARREKADFSLHYRISERSVQEAVAKGWDGRRIVDVLEGHTRHGVPDNVAVSILGWAAAVRVLRVRRPHLLTAETKEALDALLRVRELREVAGERLNDTTVELSEDPANTKLSEALRAHGFLMR